MTARRLAPSTRLRDLPSPNAARAPELSPRRPRRWVRLGAEAGAVDYTIRFSKTAEAPIPPPMHIVTIP